MREILFRGKRVDNDEWVQGSLIITKTGACYILVPSEELDVSPTSQMVSFLVYHSSVGQFTGLTDKNGVKIFEGDLLQGTEKITCITHYENSIHGKITSRENKINHTVELTPSNLQLTDYYSRRCIVAGNTHDNPSLKKNLGVDYKCD